MRNRLSKVLAVVLSFLMIATTFSYAAGSDQFSDVQSGSWYVPYVDFVVDNGYMNGTSATTFEPNGNLTRAMFATILARYDGATVDNSKETAFSDVPVNQWYTGSIAWANEKSIVNGTGNGKFSPNNNITRQDLCVMVERYITYVETTTTKRHVVRDVAITFTDEADIDSYAKSAVDKAVIHGLVNGYPDGSFKPKQFITRAECAAIISRIAWVEGDGKDSHTITVYDEKGKATKVEVPTGETYTIPEGPTKANATFKSWNTQKDGKGTTYNPGEKILLTEDMTLYPIYEEEPIDDPGGGGGGSPVVPPTPDSKYIVKAEFNIADKGSATLYKEYTQDATFDQIATDLISNENQTLITNAFTEGLSKITRDKGPVEVKVGGDTYTVETTKAGVITATKNGTIVNLQEELQFETDFFIQRMNEFGEETGFSSVEGWSDFVEKICPTNIFKPSEDNDLHKDTKDYDIQLKDADELYKVLKDAVDAGIALHDSLPSQKDIYTILEAAQKYNDTQGLEYNSYTLDAQIGIEEPSDIEATTLDHMATVLADKDGILGDLMRNDTNYTVFEANENITDEANAVDTINKRTSRDYTNVNKIRAVLKAVQDAYVGNYQVKITVEKQTI